MNKQELDKLAEGIADKYVKNLEDYINKSFKTEPCIVPPLHPNCRCTLIPVVDKQFLDMENDNE